MRGIDLDGQGWVQIAYQAQNGRCILAKEQREAWAEKCRKCLVASELRLCTETA